MSSLLLAIASLYALVLGIIGLGAGRLPITKHRKPSTTRKFSIIIPFRNEENHLNSLLQDLSELEYPKDHFQVILVDDGSTDASTVRIWEFIKGEEHALSITVLNTSQTDGGKKRALILGIEHAANPWILTTDADTRLPFAWLHLINLALEEEGIEMVCGPIGYFGDGNWLQRFQTMDNLALQTISRGLFGWNKPLLANGANLCYSKALFERLGGFGDNLDHASGDDLFLLEKARLDNPNAIAYANAPDAAVYTYPIKNLKDLIQQRVRWAGKTRFQRSELLRLLAILVGLTNLALLLSPILVLGSWIGWTEVFIAISLKAILDAWLIFSSGVYFGSRPKLFDFIAACLFYPLFGTWVFLAGLGKGYKWKERSLSH